ncbi:MAG: hypothetical protein US30_C0013G0065 [Candidatus Moranbacteria bacterium GW2011_GWF2_36_839]|nr:MAG: hypothetical protein US27_C0013G0065 [Candidatus Moranbacteria bacterium GW2011_GWF1_36_78]KKQ16668.1 MAG: hypothetical protein US30_C0013G0065 [Candidatus Moranbacteria bacterium GW2011_GWF2_36_839]HAT73565.1 hypothetical protein [Candidatus Moranbacteria bacterium]HBY11459.1 hypothetical protein [Candidatus Moranbacteria bacterium]
MQKKMDNSKVIKLAVIGASLAGVAATAYFFFGPKGKKHREHAKSWAIKMKGDVIEKLEKAKEITEPIYLEIIDAVSKEYAKEKMATKEEIKAIANDLKKHWKSISKLAISAKRDVAKDASRVMRVAKKIKK